MKSLLAVLLLSASCFAQLWTGVLDPKRAIDWSKAGATISNRTSICATAPCNIVTAAGVAATLAQINAAVASALPGTVVKLATGIYSLSGSLTCNSNVTLRGDGADKTLLVFTAGGTGGIFNCVNADTNYSADPHNVAPWTAGFTAGSTAITLGTVSIGSITNLRTGSLLILDQLDDSADGGDIFVTQDTGSNGTHTQGGGSASGRPGTSPCNTPASCRSQEQQVSVLNCVGANGLQCSSGSATAPYTVTISPGLYAQNWRIGQTPGAWWSNAAPITGVGFEDFSVDVRGVGSSGQGGIFYFQNATQSWIKGVRSLNTVGNGCWKNHVRIYQSTHITVRDSYFYGSCGASDSYAVDPGYGAADNLIENNIAQQIATPWIREGDAGSVFAYNFAINDYYTPSSGLWQQSDSFHHGPDDHGLWEGNEGVSFNLDNIHNSGFMLTAFRNWWHGKETGKTQNTAVLNINAYSRYSNIVGNVLGTSSYHTIYQTNASSTTDAGNSANGVLSIYTLGYSGNQGTRWASPFTIDNDTLVATSTMRWGNWASCTGDAACNSVRFNTGEDGHTAATYPAINGALQTFPPSFYLSAKPAFWSVVGSNSPPWPAIGPDVSGGVGPGGRAYDIPAALCYRNRMLGPADGSGPPLTFNQSQCYYAPLTQCP